MAHLDASLPPEVEIGAVRRQDYGTEIVTTDGGFEVRNNRWSQPLVTFEINYPPATRNDPIYQDVLNLYEMAEGNLHSFSFTDWTDESGMTVIPVRFDSPLEINGIAGHLDHIVSIALKEVRLGSDS